MEDFVANESFQDFVSGLSHTNSFWEEAANKDPEIAGKIKAARELIKSICEEKPEIPENEYKHEFDRFKRMIQQSEVGFSRLSKNWNDDKQHK